MNKINQHKELIKQLCEKYNVENLYAFGSVLTDDFNDNSDIDLLVNFKPINIDLYADNYFDFKFSLEQILKREIDLLEEKALKNPYFIKELHNKRQLIYG